MGVTPGSVHKNMFPKSKKGRGRAQANNAANTSTDIPIRQVSMLVEDKGNDEVVVYAEYNPGKQPKGEYPKILCRLVDHLLRMTLENKNWR